jgi:GNAT superfamily N-acetyltransferase
VPEGLELVSPTREDDVAVHAAAEEAFLDHWEHAPEQLDAWQRRRADTDRSLWFAMRDGEELAGVAINDFRFGGGWVAVLGTRRPWRGRGIAQALLLATFGEFWRRGERTVRLAVDAASPTGAVRLYERVGMRAAWRADVYEKHL